MQRRTLLKLIALGALPVPAAHAQQAGKVWRIGFFYGGSRQSALETGRYAAFLQGMQEHGYIENKNYVLVDRYTEGVARATGFAKELIDAKLDLIVTSGGVQAQALKELGATVPVVIVVAVDPVRQGYAETLARPGKNFTGLSALLTDIFPKHVELLKTAAPRLSRLAILANPKNGTHPDLLERVQAAAVEHGLRPQLINASAAPEFEPAFAQAASQKPEALLILGDAFFVQHFREIARLCLKYHMISIYSGREYPHLGGFMSYGPNFPDHYRRTGRYVDRILKGARPGELPFEQPTKFELVINRSTAKSLGVPVSNQLVLRADLILD